MSNRFFSDDNFLLGDEIAKELYSSIAEEPIFDYHNHLSPKDLLENKPFDNLAEAWLSHDHYKWRLMRSSGAREDLCTGSADWGEKWQAFASAAEGAPGNPVTQWAQLELLRFFGIKERLSSKRGADILEQANQHLKDSALSPQTILSKMNVKFLCTTDDPSDSLDEHKQLQKLFIKGEVDFLITPGFRADKAGAIASGKAWLDELNSLTESSGIEVNSWERLVEALDKRHLYFHQHGTRICDTGIAYFSPERLSDKELNRLFQKARRAAKRGEGLSFEEEILFRTALTEEISVMNHSRGWSQQFHTGILRNPRTSLMRQYGPDSGADCMGDYPQMQGMAALLDRLECRGGLTRSILYAGNPADTMPFSVLAASFNGGERGKIQTGPAWWFLDSALGIETNLREVSSALPFSSLVGMLTDSRSFFSFSRHEYYRRVVANWLAKEIGGGLFSADLELAKTLLKNLSYQNAVDYFGIDPKTWSVDLAKGGENE